MIKMDEKISKKLVSELKEAAASGDSSKTFDLGKIKISDLSPAPGTSVMATVLTDVKREPIETPFSVLIIFGEDAMEIKGNNISGAYLASFDYE